MKFRPAICPQCSASLSITDDQESTVCSHCQTKIFVEKASSDVDEYKNLLTLAKVAEDAGNFREAYDLYSKILLVDLGSVEAWRGKGYAAGMQSNLIANRFNELMVCYDQALKAADPKDTDHLKIEYAVSAFQVARSYFNLSLEHTLKFIGASNVQFEHADRCRSAIDLCEYAISLDPDPSSAKTFIHDIASRCEKNKLP